MSQFPPAMTPPPPGMNPGFPPPQPPQRTSVSAVASLITAIVCCIPPVVPIILGIIGISATGKPNVSGRGVAIAGLIIGLIGLLGWAGFGGTLGVAYLKTAPARAVARQYLMDVSAGNIQAAQAASVAGTPTTTIQELSDSMKASGSLQDVTFASFNTSSQSGQPTRTTLGGVAKFSTGPKAIVVVLVKEGSLDKVESASMPTK